MAIAGFVASIGSMATDYSSSIMDTNFHTDVAAVV